MNGIHDMGGLQGLGELDYEAAGPVYHAVWEGRVHAMATALRATPSFGGFFRPEIEGIPAADYLRMSYYERWLAAIIARLVANGLTTRAEIASGRAVPGSPKATPALTPEEARTDPFRTPQDEHDLDVPARFAVGARVRGRNRHPTTHTRMPRYTRGRVGTVERDRGVFDLPDTAVYAQDPRPQHVYLVRFTARELWGDTASPRDTLYIDLWEDYLEPA